MKPTGTRQPLQPGPGLTDQHQHMPAWQCIFHALMDAHREEAEWEGLEDPDLTRMLETMYIPQANAAYTALKNAGYYV